MTYTMAEYMAASTLTPDAPADALSSARVAGTGTVLATLALMGLGLAGIGYSKRRKLLPNRSS
jgi:hypothetical protein